MMTINKDDRNVDEPRMELPAGDGTKHRESKGPDNQASEVMCQEEGAVASEEEEPVSDASRVRPEGGGDGQCRFPFPFYDPTTKQLMKDPVVDPEGNSLENPVASVAGDVAAAADGATVVPYYPNRALKTIIQREVELKCPSFVGSLRRLDDAVWQSWIKLVDKSMIGGGEVKPLPEGFYCPITAELMADPVISPSGHTFERKAIERWVRANKTNPISRDALALKSLRRNNNLYDLIQHELHKMESASHPSIIRWKDTTQQTSRPDEDVRYDDEPNAGPDNTPTNYAEMAAIRRRRRQHNTQGRSIVLVLIFTLLVFTGVLPFGAAFVLLFWTIAICACLAAAQNREQDTNHVN